MSQQLFLLSPPRDLINPFLQEDRYEKRSRIKDPTEGRWDRGGRQKGGDLGEGNRGWEVGRKLLSRMPLICLSLHSPQAQSQESPQILYHPHSPDGKLRPREKGPAVDHTNIQVPYPACHASLCCRVTLSLPPSPKGAGLSSQRFLRKAEVSLAAIIYDFLTASFLPFPSRLRHSSVRTE